MMLQPIDRPLDKIWTAHVIYSGDEMAEHKGEGTPLVVDIPEGIEEIGAMLGPMSNGSWCLIVQGRMDIHVPIDRMRKAAFPLDSAERPPDWPEDQRLAWGPSQILMEN